MKNVLRISALLLLVVCILGSFACAAEEKIPANLIYFFSQTCHRCTATRANVMPRIEKHFSDRLKVEYRDIADVENYKMLFALKQQLGADEKSVFPVLYTTGKFLDGRNEGNLTYESIASFIAQGMSREEKKASAATTSDIVKYFHKLEPLAIMSAGFADGINPCAFTVIVFFMSFLFFQGYSKKNIAIVGMSFMVAVFVTYVLLGFGIFGWLHVMKGFSLISRIISIAIGVASIALGVLSIYDAFIFRKKGESEDMVLHLPKGIKRRVQMIIGDEYRVTKDAPPRQKNVFALIGSALAVGFLISIFESLCTGQLYLPTIMFILKTSPYKLTAFGYLVLYNLMFMVPIAVIYCLALSGVSSQSFANVMKKHMFLVKLFLAAMFLFLGVSLVHADNSIAPAQMSKAEIRKDPNFYDFGTVKEGTVIKHTFMLKNNETEPINIKEINTSCACTTPKTSSNTVMPGKSVSIEIAFDTKGYPGIRKRQLFVHTDSKKNSLVIFEIQADVK